MFWLVCLGFVLWGLLLHGQQSLRIYIEKNVCVFFSMYLKALRALVILDWVYWKWWNGVWKKCGTGMEFNWFTHICVKPVYTNFGNLGLCVCVCSDRQRMLKKWQKQFGKQMQENRNKVSTEKSVSCRLLPPHYWLVLDFGFIFFLECRFFDTQVLFHVLSLVKFY